MKPNSLPSFLPSFIALIIIIFSANNLSSQSIQINQTFSSDTVITPFSGSVPATSISFSGGVNLLSDSSLVRIILIDTYGNHYMVFESYPLITMSNTFDTLGAADETAFLDGVICDSLRIDIINAFLEVDSLKLDTAYISDALQLQAQAKWNHDSVKIDIMNQRITEEHMYWRAGRTNIAEMTYAEKSELFGNSYFSLQGFEYYKGGIFEFLSYRQPNPKSSSTIVSRFNWRDRHGANNMSSEYFEGNPSPYWDGDDEHKTGWITDVWYQVSNTCWAYASVAALESLTNLYFNYHNPLPIAYSHIDLDLSEWDVVACLNKPPCPNNYGWPSEAFTYSQGNGVVNQECLENSCAKVCADKDLSQQTELVKNSGWDTVSITSEDWIKRTLITEGPWVSTINGSVFNLPVPHCMLLVGFQPVTLSDRVYYDRDNPANTIIIDSACDLIGQSIYILKNSWGADWGDKGFTSMTKFPIYVSDFYPSYPLHAHCRITGDILREGYTNDSIFCSDEDGDGYYWWGIRENPPEGCNHDPDDRDCDDSDPSVGPYNLDPTKGPLYECLPICEDFSYTPYYIDEDLTIINNRHFNCDLVVMPGNTVEIINSTISFSEQARLIIRQNATVILTNSTLTTNCPNVMWRGVEVWGNSSYSQTDPNYHQGKIELYGSVIEKATCGVTTVMYEYTPESGGPVPIPTFSGGIIQASNSLFRNNEVAVDFYPYTFENVSFFNSCVFETNNDYLDGENPDYFVKMRAVGEIPFICCAFKNIRTPGTVEWYLWGGGIYSVSSSFVIHDEGCLSPPNRSLFEGLTRGIYAINSGSNKSITINQADFIDNYRGIYCSGMTALGKLTVTSNNLKVCTPPEAIETPPYGLYLDNSTGYHIEENSFWSNALWSNHVTVGLIINNSGPDNNLIYRNTFTELNFGIIAQDRNRSEDGYSGLEFKCNTFSTDPYHFCKYDISVTTSGEVGDQIGIKRYQGSNDDDPTAPAGNIFSDEVPPPIGPIGQYQLINLCNTFTYYYHFSNSGYSTIEPVRYYYYNLIIPTVNPTLWPFIPNPDNPNSSCPSTITDNIEDSDSLRHELLVLLSGADSTITTINNLIDGGNTDLLNSTILLSWSSDSISLRNDLLIESPYLSDTVMINAIEKENVLSSEMITEILSANSHAPKSAKIMQHVAERSNQLTEEQLGLIYEGFNYHGELEGLELALSMLNQKYQNTFGHLIDHYRTSYQGSIASDSVIALSTSFGNVQKHYEAIIEALEYGDTIMAWQIFNAIPLSFSLSVNEVSEYDAFEEYLSIRNIMIYYGYSIMDPDSSMKDELYNLMDNTGQLTSAFARNMLIASDSLQYLEPIILPDPTLKQGDRIRFNRGSIIHKTEFTLYPNPASTYVIAQYDYLKPENTGRLDFIDGTGRLCLQVPLRPGTKYEIIKIADLSTGIYLCSLNLTGYKKSTCTLVISR